MHERAEAERAAGTFDVAALVVLQGARSGRVRIQSQGAARVRHGCSEAQGTYLICVNVQG